MREVCNLSDALNYVIVCVGGIRVPYRMHHDTSSETRRFAANIFFVCCIAVVLFLPCLVFNVMLDPHGIFHPLTKGRTYLNPNEQFIKVTHLLRHADQYDSLIFGNSRANALSVSRFPNGRWYNFSVSGSLPAENLYNLNILSLHGMAIKRILVGLDGTFSSDPDRAEMLPYKPYPQHLREWPAFNASYVLSIPSWNLIERSYKPKDAVRYDYTYTGQMFFTDAEQRIDRDPQKHIETFLTSGVLDARPGQQEEYRYADTLREIRALKVFCDAHDITLTLFIHPVSKPVRERYNESAFQLFRTELAQITPYWDFSDLSDVTANPLNYFELDHYRRWVGDLMIDRMMGTATTTFGRFVSHDGASASTSVAE
jgi:hypothetical protein